MEGNLLHPGCLSPTSLSSRAPPANGLPYQGEIRGRQRMAHRLESDGVAQLQAIMDLQRLHLEAIQRQVNVFNASVNSDVGDSLRLFIVEQLQKLEVSLESKFANIALPCQKQGIQIQPDNLQAASSKTAEAGNAAKGGQPDEPDAVASSVKAILHQGQQPTAMDAGGSSFKSTPDGVRCVTPQAVWELGELDKAETPHSWFNRALQRKLSPKPGILHSFFKACALGPIVPSGRPTNFMVRIADSHVFHLATGFVILASTLFSVWSSDRYIRWQLQDPPTGAQDWWDVVSLVFLMYYLLEMLIRLAAFRLWFFCDPGLWQWNVFDLFIALESVVDSTSVDVSFLRLLRTFRVMRMMRILLQTPALKELRDLICALAACFVPLLWASLFVFATMCFFAIAMLQLVAPNIKEHYDDIELIAYSRESLYGFDSCIKTLFVAVCGSDWLAPHEALSQYNWMSAMLMPVFVVFTNIGVMNIVVGVFADASAGSKDRNAIAAEQIRGVEEFVQNMRDFITDFDPNLTTMTWKRFSEYFHQETVQAYFAYHGLDSSHVHLIFNLMDQNSDGEVDIHELIIGMLRMKGEARKLEQRAMFHALKYMSQLMGEHGAKDYPGAHEDFQ